MGGSICYRFQQANFLTLKPVREYRRQTSALPEAHFTALRDALLSSPLVGRSTLAGPFLSSRGFAVIFREAGREKVVERFPSLRPYLDAVLGAPAVRALTPWWVRQLTRVPNAWYLNVLLVSEGGTVARHVDATLRKPAEEPEATPELVSVLYLSVPKARGGELQLWEGPTPITRLTPKENALVHFRGDLAHQVNAFEGAKDAVRASLVIEQYHFADEALARLPEFRLESRAGFSAYLAHHQSLHVEP
jgi:hypothetical protein